MLLTLLLASLSLISANHKCPSMFYYDTYFDKCYQYVDRPLGFLAAERYCEALGGHLVNIDNAFEGTYISGMVSDGSPVSNYWIGANLLMDSNWTWTSGKPFYEQWGYYTNWDLNQPSDPSAKQCASVRIADNRWTKEICNTPLPFVCAVDYSMYYEHLPSCSSCYNAVCSPGYQLFPETCRCYKLYDKEMTHSDAELQCSNDNGTLAKVSTPELDTFLYFLLPYDRTGWIGLSCDYSISTLHCHWPDDSPMEYQHFGDGPRNDSNTMIDGGLWESSTVSGQTAYALCETAPESVQYLLKKRKADF